MRVHRAREALLAALERSYDEPNDPRLQEALDGERDPGDLPGGSAGGVRPAGAATQVLKAMPLVSVASRVMRRSVRTRRESRATARPPSDSLAG